jgi:hypothetical protein
MGVMLELILPDLLPAATEISKKTRPCFPPSATELPLDFPTLGTRAVDRILTSPEEAS